MIEEIERCLAYGEDLEKVRLSLLEKEARISTQRRQDIEHDIRQAELIQYGLQFEPHWSPAYGVSRGIVNRLRKQYQKDDSLVRQLKRDIWEMDHPKEKDPVQDDADVPDVPDGLDDEKGDDLNV